jgi:hypothetical protein
MDQSSCWTGLVKKISLDKELFLTMRLGAMSVPERRAMVEPPSANLSVRRQCELLNLARSGVYRPRAGDRRR